MPCQIAFWRLVSGFELRLHANDAVVDLDACHVCSFFLISARQTSPFRAGRMSISLACTAARAARYRTYRLRAALPLQNRNRHIAHSHKEPSISFGVAYRRSLKNVSTLSNALAFRHSHEWQKAFFRFIGVSLRFLRGHSLTYPRFGGLSTAMNMRRTPVSLGADICRANHAGTWQNIGGPVCERSEALCLHLALR